MAFTRDQGLVLLNEHIKNQNLIKHSYAVEAVMKRFAPKFQGNVEEWALTGLLHDLDWEKTQKTPDQHTIMSEKILVDAGVAPHIVKAIKVHNFAHGLVPETDMEKVLYYVEELTGLVTACALVNPEKLAGVKVDSVLKKLKQLSFAKGVNRELIAQAPAALNMTLEQIIQEVLESMLAIRGELGL